jgi:demethylmenaquinone methyltransferase / 2-methoxy-6-polyprenyl-1,4-benzoquinol methylase
MSANTIHPENVQPLKPYGKEGVSKKEEVALMFDNISGKYDLLNHVLSLGIDKGWRNKAIALLKNDAPKQLLDVATGTGDFAISALKIKPVKITGVDISEGMLEVGRKKIASKGLTTQIELFYGDSENLPFLDNTFDAATVAFGVRNFENLDNGLLDIYRVLKSGGKLVILEFSKPTAFPVKQLYKLYFNFILPTVGKLISGDNSAYTYLPESVNLFPDGEQFLERMNKAGFRKLTQKRLTFGIASIYTGVKNQ